MLAMVEEMIFANAMVSVNGEVTRFADQGQVTGDRNGAVIEEHVMVRAQAEDVVCGVRAFVRGTERPDLRRL